MPDDADELTVTFVMMVVSTIFGNNIHCKTNVNIFNTKIA